MKKAIFILISSIFVVACNDIDNCNSNSDQSFMVVRFFDIEDLSSKRMNFEVRAVTGGLGTFFVDSTFYSSDSTALILLLDAEDTTMTFTFDSSNVNHELQIRYTPQFSIFDPSCDPSLTFLGLDTLRSTFDSTVVVGGITNRQLATNIEVYF